MVVHSLPPCTQFIRVQIDVDFVVYLFIYNLYLILEDILYNFPDDSDVNDTWSMCVHDVYEKGIDGG